MRDRSMVFLSSLTTSKGLQTGPFGSQLKADEYTDDGVPVVMPKDIYGGKITAKGIARVPEEKAKKLSKHRLRSGDILFPRRGDLGRIAVVREDNEGWLCGSGCLRARLRSNVAPVYVHQYVQLSLVKRWLESNALGQTMLNLNTEIIGNLPIFIVPEEEQIRISSILSTWDHAIEKTEGLIVAEETRFSWLLKKVINEESIQGEWNRVKLGDIVEINKGQQLNVSDMVHFGRYYVLNGGIELSGFTDQWNMKENTITISEGGNSCGYVNFNTEKFWCGGHCYALNNLKNEVDSRYLYNYLKKHEKSLMLLRVGSGLPNIQKKDIQNFPITFPPLSMQKYIATALDTARQEIDLLRKQADAYRKQKRGLMHKLLTGQWRVRI